MKTLLRFLRLIATEIAEWIAAFLCYVLIACALMGGTCGLLWLIGTAVTYWTGWTALDQGEPSAILTSGPVLAAIVVIVLVAMLIHEVYKALSALWRRAKEAP